MGVDQKIKTVSEPCRFIHSPYRRETQIMHFQNQTTVHSRPQRCQQTQKQGPGHNISVVFTTEGGLGGRVCHGTGTGVKSAPYFLHTCLAATPSHCRQPGYSRGGGVGTVSSPRSGVSSIGSDSSPGRASGHESSLGEPDSVYTL